VAANSVHIAVSGGGEADDVACRMAEDVGRELARRGAVVVTGGLGGAMAAACRGAKAEGGTTIGILADIVEVCSCGDRSVGQVARDFDLTARAFSSG